MTKNMKHNIIIGKIHIIIITNKGIKKIEIKINKEEFYKKEEFNKKGRENMKEKDNNRDRKKKRKRIRKSV